MGEGREEIRQKKGRKKEEGWGERGRAKQRKEKDKELIVVVANS